MFGTLKRQRGFTFTLARDKENVPGEVGLMVIGYNPPTARQALCRCISVLGAEKLILALKKCCFPRFLSKTGLIISRINEFLISTIKILFAIRIDFNVTKASLFNSKKLYLYVN
jgi:hypothetical protein